MAALRRGGPTRAARTGDARLNQTEQEAEVEARALHEVELLAADSQKDRAEHAAVARDDAAHEAAHVQHAQHVPLQRGEQVRDVGLRVGVQQLHHVRAHMRRERVPHVGRLARRHLVHHQRHGALQAAGRVFLRRSPDGTRGIQVCRTGLDSSP